MMEKQNREWRCAAANMAANHPAVHARVHSATCCIWPSFAVQQNLYVSRHPPAWREGL
jgi:hypothetical protein